MDLGPPFLDHRHLPRRGDVLDVAFLSADRRQQQIAGLDSQFPSELVGQKHKMCDLAALGQGPERFQLRRLAVPELALWRGVMRCGAAADLERADLG